MINYIRNKKGFTLVEIIVVLVIIAILAAAALPALTGYIDDAREKTAVTEGRNVLVAAQTIASQMNGADVAVADIVSQIEQPETSKMAKYPCINGLTGMRLNNADITNATVRASDGTVSGFKLKASNGKNITYGLSGFTMG